MNEFETLLGLVGDNAEAKAVIAKIQTAYTEKDTSLQSITSQFEDAKKSRDKYKQGNALVKKALGLDKINEESVTAKLKDLAGGDKLKEQAQELAEQIAKKDDEINSIKSEYEGKMDNFAVGLESKRGMAAVADQLVDDPLIRDAFEQHVSAKIGKIGEVIAPFKMIGDIKTPIVDGDKPMDVAKFYKEIIADDKFAAFRKPSTGAGAGGTGGGTPANKDVSKMTAEERFDYYEAKEQ